MSSIPNSDHSIRSSVSSVLRPYRKRWLFLASTRMVLWSLATIVVIWIAAMWIDLVWALPDGIRWWVSRIAPQVAILVTAAALLVRLIHFNDDAIARCIDAEKDTGGEVLVGLQLEARPWPSKDSLTLGMASLAVDRSRQLAASFSTGDVFRFDSLRRPSVILFSMLSVVLLVAMIVPAIAKTQVTRLLSPTSDVPPYTGVMIELQLDRDSVTYGDSTLIRATSTGARVERMQLVIRTLKGEESVLPMLPTANSPDTQSETHWQAMLSNVTEPLIVFAMSGRSRSTQHELKVILLPQLLPPTVRITPPEYTRYGTYEGPIPDHGIEGLPDTEVMWRLASNRPLASGRIDLQYRDETRETIQLWPDTEDASRFVSRQAEAASSTVYGSMRLTRPGQFTLSVTDIDGITSRESISGSIGILKDGHPVVRITSPRPISLATPNIKLPVTIEGADDYGIARMWLYRSLNGSPASKMELETDGTRQQRVRWDLPLDQYGLSSGDEIQLFARIEDNDPNGAKGAESPVTVVRIISQVELDELRIRQKGVESLQAKYAAAQRQLEHLAEALRAVDEAAKRAAEDGSAESRERLHEKLAAAKQAADEAAEAMEKFSQHPMPIDVDRELTEKLAAQAKQIQQLSKQLENATAADPQSQQDLSSEQQEMLRRLGEQVASQRQDLQQNAVEPLQQLQQIMPLIVDQQRFEQLVRQQRDLARRLNSLNSETDPEQGRVAELETQQQQLRRALDQLLDDIEAHAKALPDEPSLEKLRRTAEEFVDGIRESQAESEMLSAQQGLLENQFADAYDDAKSAADILESFLSQCKGMGDQACQNCQMAFNPGAGGASLGNSIEQILSMMGMKPGASGMRPGGSPGMGLGWGAGGGYSMRQPGPNNVGMYGAMPTSATSPRQGRGDRASGGIASIRSGSPGGGQSNQIDQPPHDAGGGQADQAIPGKYRDKVSEYFRQLAEQLGE
ncbi:hypothetical protein Enr13x_34210 [Stieleria neptunia]|uniref:Uncharacterized protein n=1 Tax=Stieleria neptunia TaxID=2527979 RepID=A0A518HRX1_9BACT|nr:hypothetical protein [Stieleria neptunia]QDV43564.1 hypothetical protein Enr13x_34210 [Stieleria neptunia]